MITAAQRERRRKFIGSSDAAAIAGLDPYRTATDVWLDKTNRLDTDGGSEATDRGNWLEPALISFAEHRLGRSLVRDQMYEHKNGILAANLDAVDPEKKEIVEGKTTVLRDEWGDEYTDDIPKRVIVQVHHQFAVMGKEYRVCHVPVLMPGYKSFDFRMYRIERNDELADMIAQQDVDFVEKYIRSDTPPEHFKPSMEVVKRIRREPNKTISIPKDLVAAWQIAAEAKKMAEEELEAAKLAVLACLGDAEAGNSQLGLVTYLETNRKGYEVKPTSFRTLRLKAAK